MATNASIIRKTETGKFEGIYCHFDGYLAAVGTRLQNHYQDPAKVAALIDLGDISTLGERVEPVGPHTWLNPEKGTTLAYGRDRGEKGTEKQTADTAEQLAEEIGARSEVYVFADGAWTHNGRLYAPDVLNGMHATEEVEDIGDRPRNVTARTESPILDDVQAPAPAAEVEVLPPAKKARAVKAEPVAPPATDDGDIFG